MPALKGLLKPENFDKSAGGFKEGIVRVDTSAFRVCAGYTDEATKRADPPAVALVWNVTRLEEDSMEPMHDHEDKPLTEELVFKLGGKSLAMVHPAVGTSPGDEEPDDQGEKVNTEGNTLSLIAADGNFKLHPNSSLAVLSASLQKAGAKPEYMERVWAPDWVGHVFFMKQWVDESNKRSYVDKQGVAKESGVSYKIVDKIIKTPGAATGKAAKGAAAGKGEAAAGAGSNGAGDNEAAATAIQVMEAISEAFDGQALTFKKLSQEVGSRLQKANTPTKLQIAALSLVKDLAWMNKNAPKLDMTVNAEERTVAFGTQAAVQG